VPGRVPPSLIVTVVLSLLVAAGALVGAGALRLHAARTAQGPSTSGKPGANPLGSSGCLVDPCRVLGTATVGGTSMDLVADAGARSGRLRIGGPNSSQVIPATVTETGVILTEDSLRCMAGGPSACLIMGRLPDERVVGQTVVGRADNWASGQTYVSNAGYLALANVDGDASPEILAAQHDCASSDPAACAGRPVRIQAFDLSGSVVGCTRTYTGLERLPGFPVVKVTTADLGSCK
jgi:hypothetical protein